MPTLARALGALLVAALAAAPSAAQTGITPIHPSAGASDIVLLDISHDGRVLVGYETLGPYSAEQVSRSVHWEDGALTVIPGIPSGTTGNQARAVSADGRAVFGQWASPLTWPTSGGIYRWTADSVSQSPTWADIDVRGASADGLTAVAMADIDFDGLTYRRPVVWNAPTGAWSVIASPNGQGGMAHGASADGAVVAGHFDDNQVFRSAGGGVALLSGMPYGGQAGWGAVTLSDDGRTIHASGMTGQTIPWPGGGEAHVRAVMRWRDGVTTTLPMVGGAPSLAMYECETTAASPDGTVVAGHCIGEDGEDNNYPSVIWREGQPPRFLRDILEDEYGLDLAGWDFECEDGGVATAACFVFGIADGGAALVGRAVYNGQPVAYRVGLSASEITVNETGDEPDADVEDEACDADPAEPGEQCTLRAAIETANAEAGDDRVVFDFSDEEGLVDVETIALGSALPEVSEPVEIEAAAPPETPLRGAAPQPLVVVDGGDAIENGLVLTAGESTVRGMAFVGFTGAAIRIEGPGGNTVEGNYLGVDPDGVTLRGNTYGVHIDGSRENTVGGDTEAARNVIGVPPSPAGTPLGELAAGVFIDGDAADANSIVGNYIGVTADGTAMLADVAARRSGVGVLITGADSTVIGGAAQASGQAPGNVISGLALGVAVSHVTGDAQFAAAFDTRIAGNHIGTNAVGADSLSNGTGVLLLGGALFTTVGGASAAEGNVISGNQGAGIQMTDGGSAGEPIPPIGSQIVGNTIGLAAGGLAPLGNQVGVSAGGEATGSGGQSPGVRGVAIGEPDYPRNLIGGNRLMQIFVAGAGYGDYAGPDATPEQIALSYVYVRNNYIGLLANGQVALSGTDRTPLGVLVAGGARAVIGSENGRNVIGGHQVGVYLVSRKNLVFSNYIGTDPTGLQPRPNLYGLFMTGSDNLVGRPPADGQPYTGEYVLAWGNLVSGNENAGMALAPGIPVPIPGGEAMSRHLSSLGGPDADTVRRGGVEEGGPAILIGNRVGVSAAGGALPNGAAFVPDPNFPEMENGGGVLAFLGESYLLWNVLAGNVGDGVGVYDARVPELEGQTVAHVVGNFIGVSTTATGASLDLPNTRDGVYNLGGDVRVGLQPAGGGIPTPGGDLRNLVWNNGRNGVTTAGFGRLYVANGSFRGNGALGIDAGIAGPNGPGVPPGFLLPPGVFNPTLLVADGDSTLRLPTRTPPATEEGGTVQHHVEVYFSGACDASGYGEGLASIAARTAAPESDAVVEIPLNAASGYFRRLAALGVYLTATVTQELSPGGGLAPVFRTSEFSECVRLALPEDVTEADVADGDTGPVLDGAGVDVDVTDNTAGTVARGHSSHLVGGTLYASRHHVVPDQNVFAGTATSPDGVTVAPDTVATRYWTLAATGLSGVTYTACLDASGLSAPPTTFVVLQRTRIGTRWAAHDASIDAGSGRICASGLTAFGDLALGARSAVAVAVSVVDGQRGWRMLSAPLAGLTVGGLAARNLVQGVPGFYPDAGTNLYTGFDGAAYVVPSGGSEALLPGHGFFWQLYDLDLDPGGPSVSRSLPMTLALGGDAPPTEVVVPLHTAGEGWNLVGNPFPFEIDLSGIGMWAEGGALASYVGQVWDPNAGSTGSYVPTTLLGDQLPVWSGMFVENADADALRVPSSAAVPPAPAQPDDPDDVVEAPRLIAFELAGTTSSGAPLVDRALVAVFRDGAGEGWDSWDARKLVPLGSPYLTAAFVGERGGQTVLKAQDSRARDAASFDVPLVVEAVGTGPELTLRWSQIERVPSSWRLTLRDLVTGTEVDLRTANEYAFEVEPSAWAGPTNIIMSLPTPHTLVVGADALATMNRFVLHVETNAVVANELDTPTVFALAAPAPNPTTGAAVVSFDVPETSAVSVAVYDLLGRRVAVLAQGQVAAGRHASRLEAGALAPGVYVVRMQAGTFSATRRVTVVR
ncbi:MAG TPA: T9SS type A sorting domain-containing protein [Rubricoccaceae bacterium]